MARRKKRGFTVITRLPNSRRTQQILGVDRRGAVQDFVTNDILKRIIPYIPKRTGDLRSDAQKDSSTAISVKSRYARVQFFGVTKDGRPFNYSPLGGAKAGSHWDRRLIANEGKAIVADANRFVRSRRK